MQNDISFIYKVTIGYNKFINKINKIKSNEQSHTQKN